MNILDQFHFASNFFLWQHPNHRSSVVQYKLYALLLSIQFLFESLVAHIMMTEVGNKTFFFHLSSLAGNSFLSMALARHSIDLR